MVCNRQMKLSDFWCNYVWHHLRVSVSSYPGFCNGDAVVKDCFVENLQLFVTIGVFFCSNCIHISFSFVGLETRVLNLAEVATCSQIGQKIEGDRILTLSDTRSYLRRHTHVIVMTSSNVLMFGEILSQSTIVPGFVVIQSQIRDIQEGSTLFGCFEVHVP